MNASALADMPVVAADDTPVWDELTAEIGDPLDGGVES